MTKSKDFKIVIIGGDYDYNMGDKASHAAIIALLKKAIPSCSITTFSFNWQVDRELYGVNAINRSIRNIATHIKVIKEADLVVWGGGVALQDDTSKVKVPYWFFKIFFIKLFLNKPIMGFGQGIGPLNTPLGRNLSRLTVDMIDLMTVRDEGSKRLLEEVGVAKTPIYAVADPAITLVPADRERVLEILFQEGVIKGDRPWVGISPCLWFHHYGSLIPHEYAVKYKLRPIRGREKFDKLQSNLAKIADYIVDKISAELIFIPMYSIPHEADDKVCFDIIKRMKNASFAKVITGNYPINEFLGIFGELDLMIGVRMHSTILAVSMNVPSINIYYVPKGLNFFRMIGQEQRAIDIDSLLETKGIERLIEIINDTWEKREEIKGQLAPKIKKIRERAIFAIELMKSYFLRGIRE